MPFIWELLEFISTAGGIMPPYKAYRYRFHRKPNTVYGSIYRLEQKNLIRKTINRSRETVYIITEKGKKLISKPVVKVPRSDGFSTLVAFDIPEEKRSHRRILRRILLKNGYTTIQKSLLASPHKISQDLLELIDELKIKPNVKIISGKFDYL